MTGQPFPAWEPQRAAFDGGSTDDGSTFLPPDLADEDRAEIGQLLVQLLFGLHESGALRPTVLDGPESRGLEVTLKVPGAGDVVARLRLADGYYELSVLGTGRDDVLVLRESEGRLSDLYRHYFTSREEEQLQAKERLVKGLRQLMLVNDWGVHHYRYS